MYFFLSINGYLKLNNFNNRIKYQNIQLSLETFFDLLIDEIIHNKNIATEKHCSMSRIKNTSVLKNTFVLEYHVLATSILLFK